MNLAEAAELVGHVVTVRYDQFALSVNVLEAKQSYGEFRFKVTPVSGSGEAWVSEGRILRDEVAPNNV